MSLINKEVSAFSVQAFQDNAFHTVNKEDLLGKWSVFFFYPADFTFVCPTELEDLQNNYEKFKAINCEIYSVSCDTHFVHKAWHDHSERISKLEYPMLADPTHTLARDFEVLIEEDAVVDRCVVMEGSVIKRGAKVYNAIVAPNTTIESGVVVNANSKEIALVGGKVSH